MSQRLFTSPLGFTDGKVSYLSGTGAPGGDAGLQDAAAIGSRYGDNGPGGNQYRKIAAGAGAGNWERQPDLSDITGLSNTTPWREPAKVYTTDDQATVLTDIDTDDLIQTEAVVVGMRILIDDGTASPNVYIVGGSTGAWTLTEDTNEESAGDVVNVIGGDQAGNSYTFNGTVWVWTGSQTSSEDSFQNTFMGKTVAGTEQPAYGSANYIGPTDALTGAIGKLDTQVKTNTDGIATNGGNITANANGIATNVTDIATNAAGIATNVTDIATNTAGIATNVTDIATNAAGIATNVTDIATNTSDIATNVTDIATNTSDIAALNALIVPTSGTGTNTYTLDSVSVDDNVAAKWLVTATDPTNGKREAFEVYAMHDGYGVTDATADPDFTVYSKLNSDAGKISGLSFDVDVTGVGVAQTMNLQISASGNIDVTATRVSA